MEIFSFPTDLTMKRYEKEILDVDSHLLGIFLVALKSLLIYAEIRKKPSWCHFKYLKNYMPTKEWNWPPMFVVLLNSPSFLDICEGFAETSYYTFLSLKG